MPSGKTSSASWMRSSKKPATKTCICPCSSPSPSCRKRKTMWRALPRSAPGSPTAAAKSWRSATASAPLPRRSSVSTIRTSFTPIATCPSSTTSGAACSAGKRPPAPSCATGNFSGRKATLCMPLKPKPGRRPSGCWASMPTLWRTCWPCPWSGAGRLKRRSSTARRRPTRWSA